MGVLKVNCPSGVFLKNYLLSENIHLSTLCGGRGYCGKCIVRIIKGTAGINTMDKIWLTQEQIDQGYRLGCHVYAKEPLVVEVPQKD